MATTGGGAGERVRVRELGVAPGVFPPGRWNAITDVAGVRVGHVSLVRDDTVRTGVTAVLPHGGDPFQEAVPAAVYVGNGYGKLAGSTQVRELGTLESPVVLTNTGSVGTAVDAVIGWTLRQPGNGSVTSVNALVGETNDGRLNDIRGRHVTGDDVIRAIETARSGPVEQGAVGAGTGTVCFGWKGGIGTSSRLPGGGAEPYTLGVLVQTNYGGLLTLAGVPVGAELGHDPFATGAVPVDGSCMIVVATDAPLSPRDLERLAARAVFALARTGSSYSDHSGDYAVAFSTARGRPGSLPSRALNALFQGVLEATEEAVYDSLCTARTTTGNGLTVEALPLDRVRVLLRRYGRG